MKLKDVTNKLKKAFSVVNDRRLNKFFLNSLKFHVRYIGFLSNTKLGGYLYGTILSLYFLKVLGEWGSYILGWIIFYTACTAILLVFSVRFPPLKEKMRLALGEPFLLKHLGNPGWNAVTRVVIPSALLGIGNYKMERIQVAGFIQDGEHYQLMHEKYWADNGILPSDEERRHVFDEKARISTQKPRGLIGLATSIFKDIGQDGD